MSRLLEYWPTSQRAVECIKSEAEAVNRAVLLAVHQPMLFRRKRFRAAELETRVETESELLEYFLQPDLPEGRLILPIVGQSGTGKSHAIKWLEWQLEHADGADRRQIVRVPKGTSLRGVLKLLLDQLGGRYDDLRDALANAHERLDEAEAPARLLDSIRIQLESLDRAAENRRKAKTPEPGDREVRYHCGRSGLRALLLIPEVRDKHFLAQPNGVVTLLAEHLHKDAGREEDLRRHQFKTTDLDFGDHVNLAEIPTSARQYYSDLVNNERYQQQAVLLLNSVLDRAKGELLQLGDRSLTELLGILRERMLRQNLELVLLVEDFAVLSGLQGALLQAIIKEAVTDGKRTLCNIRTALAYTPGYEQVKDTAMTRAGFEWHLYQDSDREPEYLENLVGAYLNAARSGSQVLQRALKDSSEPSKLDSWIPRHPIPDNLPDEIRDEWNAFGESSRGFGLFPFNAAAIAQWTAHAGRVKGEAPNARLIIKHVIRRVLQDRDLYEDNRYPPDDLDDVRSVSPVATSHVLERYPGEAGRRIALLRFWGGNPASAADAESIAAGVCTAFGLSPPHNPQHRACADCDRPVRGDSNYCAEHASTALCAAEGCSVAVAGQRTRCPAHSTAESRTQCHLCDEPTFTNADHCKNHKALGKWRTKLLRWIAGGELEPDDARHLRHMIAEAMMDYVPWNTHGLRLSPKVQYAKYFHNFVELPNAGGGSQSDEQFIIVGTKEDLKTPTRSGPIHNAALAILRHRKLRNWDYKGAEVDSAAYANFMEAHASHAVAFARRHYHMVYCGNSVPVLVETLLVGAVALGRKPHRGSNAERLSAVLRSEDYIEGGPSLPDKVHSFTDAKTVLAGHRTPFPDNRRVVLDMLLDQIAFRQGNGDPIAVDVPQLLAVLRKIGNQAALTLRLPEVRAASRSQASELRQFRIQHEMLRRSLTTIAKRECRDLGLWHREAFEWFGDDKTTLQSELRSTLKLAEENAIDGTAKYPWLRRLVTNLTKISTAPALKLAAEAADATETAKQLNILGLFDWTVRDKMDQMRVAFNAFFKSYEACLKRESTALGEDGGVQNVRDAITNELKEIETALVNHGGLLNDCE